MDLAGDVVRHTLVAYDTATGEELWRYCSPAISAYDSVRYGQVGDGIVVTNDPTTTATASGSWAWSSPRPELYVLQNIQQLHRRAPAADGHMFVERRRHDPVQSTLGP
jgi:hypothetical protein